MTLGTISICMTVLVLNVHHRGAREPPPKCMKRFVLAYLARVLCIKTSMRVAASEKVYAKRSKHKLHKGTHDGNGLVDDMELIALTVANSNSKTAACALHINGPRAVPSSPPTPRRDNTPRVRIHQVPSVEPRPTSPTDSEEPPDYSKEWHEIAHVLDRLFFWFLFWLMTGSAVFILLYPKYTGIEDEQYQY